MHELVYEMKAMGKEQYHNNFGCYGFIARPNASYPVPTYRKRWPGAWMEERFYVKNDLKAREDIKEVIMRPFGLASASEGRRLKLTKRLKHVRRHLVLFASLLVQDIWFKST
jgi:hypothetical protein